MASKAYLILAMILISSFAISPAKAGREVGEIVYHVHQSKYLSPFILQLAAVMFETQNVVSYTNSP